MSEREVVVRSVDSPMEDLKTFGAAEQGHYEPKPIEFSYATHENFRAEYALVNEDLIVHFFLPESVDPSQASAYRNWWYTDFAKIMSEEAQAYFGAEYPRIMAKYTEEVASWWLKAQGYDHLLDPLAYLQRFFAQLDARLLETGSPFSSA